jgi:hypothetical protein
MQQDHPKLPQQKTVKAWDVPTSVGCEIPIPPHGNRKDPVAEGSRQILQQILAEEDDDALLNTNTR